MYICKKCNKEVEEPQSRLWRKYCPRHHRLLRDAVVQSFWGSFARAFGKTIFVLFTALMVLAVSHNSAAEAAETHEYVKIVLYLFGFLLFIAFLNGFLAFKASREWKKRGGAIEKLIPRARGRAFGSVSAAGLMTIYVLPMVWMAGRK